ncbi:MAG: gamma carbonic anhydrase family protein [Rickettsiales bacterium]|nr:gamma carbonic anhydrase family protein [Rickettsiales bacterium]
MNNNIFAYLNTKPQIHKDTFIAPTASIIGNVSIGKNCSVWFNCVIRGDVEQITIDNYTNIQDGTVIHVTRNGSPTKIGSYVTVGHKALIHACTIEDLSFIGMGSIIMDKAIIEEGGWVAAGALITPGKVVRKNEIWAGNPAKLLRHTTKQEQEYIKISAQNYANHIQEYQNI